MAPKTTVTVALAAALLSASVFAAPVDGPGTIMWKGLEWNVDVNATAEVDPYGNLQISVGGDTGDPAADNWNIHRALTDLFSAADYGQGVWFEFSFIDIGQQPDGNGGFAYGGGPRAYLDTWEVNPNSGNNTEYMFQGGMYDGYSVYYVNHATYHSGDWDASNWYFPGGRSQGVHTFKAQLTTGATDLDNVVEMWYDGSYMGSVSGRDNVPTFFETAFLGVTSNGIDPGGPGYGVYTDFQYGVVPEPASIGLIVAAAALLLRRR